MARILSKNQKQNLDSFYISEEIKAKNRTKKKVLSQKRKEDKTKYQSFNNVKINSSQEIIDIQINNFKEDPFVLDVFYILINAMDIYNTAYLTAEDILNIIKGPENLQKKKKYYFNCQITLHRINKALNILEAADIIKNSFINNNPVIFINYNYAIKTKIKSRNELPEEFPDNFIINKRYSGGNFKSIDTHNVVLNKNLELIRNHPSSFSYHMILTYHMNIGNVVSMSLEDISSLLNMSLTTIETYNKDLVDFGLIKKIRQSNGKIRINTYKLNSIFSWMMDFVHIKMMAFYRDIYDLSGVIGVNKTRYNQKRNKKYNSDDNEYMNEGLINHAYKEVKYEVNKQKRDEHYKKYGTLAIV